MFKIGNPDFRNCTGLSWKSFSGHNSKMISFLILGQDCNKKEWLFPFIPSRIEKEVGVWLGEGRSPQPVSFQKEDWEELS